MGKSIGCVLLLCTLSQPASAHWQYTKWGMSPDQVVAVSKGQANRVPEPSSNGRGEATSVKGHYEASGKNFTVSFRFKNDALTGVTLEEKGNQTGCSDLLDELTGVYGPVIAQTGGRVHSWNWIDPTRHNLVELSNIGMGYCYLFYAEQKDATTTGL